MALLNVRKVKIQRYGQEMMGFQFTHIRTVARLKERVRKQSISNKAVPEDSSRKFFQSKDRR